MEPLRDLAVPRLTRDDLHRLREMNAAMLRSAERRDPVAAFAADEAFHDVWIVRSNNSELFVLLAQLKTKLRRLEFAYWGGAARASQSFREHAAIIRALQQGSRRKALQAVHQNWQGSVLRLRTLAENEPAKSTSPSSER